ncbi:SgcJ/EcaC family oxidoreductase [Paenirhodobacter enshiensis]|uniref:DUF4440 domain-containing protein n=1 Tax=Paenirhodobacter enshiensis TaxID=1105367 RepID=A0A086Y1S8_9RHOB|nr:SgcJ/EcaC family oxidoreductase [Paenirhodobacter enshiensis]KFI28228.1 hypothetical protein CG50_15200 [Paenirhodobacter enshiensis]
MSLPAPDALTRSFAAAWAAHDAEALAAMFAEDSEFLSLTGGHAEGRADIADLFAAELAGAFARARLVTGKIRIRPVGESVAVVSQRFVLSGILNADGSDAGRIGALFCATMAHAPGGWQIVAAQFVVEA